MMFCKLSYPFFSALFCVIALIIVTVSVDSSLLVSNIVYTCICSCLHPCYCPCLYIMVSCLYPLFLYLSLSICKLSWSLSCLCAYSVFVQCSCLVSVHVSNLVYIVRYHFLLKLLQIRPLSSLVFIFFLCTYRKLTCAGILEQSVGARNPVGTELAHRHM
jgi:hypothetical protein